MTDSRLSSTDSGPASTARNRLAGAGAALLVLVLLATPVMADIDPDLPAEEVLAAGIEAYQRERFQPAAELFQRAAELGNSEAAFRLAFMYEHGEGLNPSMRRAIEWYKRAALGGHEPAQFNLGQMYASGRGIEVDAEEGARWYRMSARQGNPHAQYTLALMYFHGDAGSRDLVQAYNWITQAVHGFDANHLRDNANQVRRVVLDSMNEEQKTEGRRLVNEALDRQRQ